MQDRTRKRIKIDAMAPSVTAKSLLEEREKDLHQKVKDLCAERGYLPLTGSMAHRTFRQAGEWDFTILADKSRVFFIELKNRTGKLSPDQQAIIKWAEKLGHKVSVCRSIEEVKELILP